MKWFVLTVLAVLAVVVSFFALRQVDATQVRRTPVIYEVMTFDSGAVTPGVPLQLPLPWEPFAVAEGKIYCKRRVVQGR